MTKKTEINQTQEEPATQMKKVEAALIKEIQERGVVHVFGWIGGWYERVAQAQMADDFNRQFAGFTDDPEAQEYFYSRILRNEATSVSNYSTSQGDNLLKQARVAICARELQYIHSDASTASFMTNSGISVRQDKLFARLSAERRAKEAAATQSGQTPAAE